MDRLRSFRELIVWQKSHQLFLDFVKDVEFFPRNQAGKIVVDQILRSSASISANIAEGFGRRKGKSTFIISLLRGGLLPKPLIG